MMIVSMDKFRNGTVGHGFEKYGTRARVFVLIFRVQKRI